ncbi:MAG: tail protein X [Schwartzia sp.]|nr:tail protein X [Schwartzia sp. (in: firmicutes)]
MWDLIAYKVYGKEAYISKLLEANEDLKEIVVFPAGVTIVCPEADAETSRILPPWRR